MVRIRRRNHGVKYVDSCDGGERGWLTIFFCPLFTPLPPSHSQDAAREDHKKKQAMISEWNEEELRMLDKALVKFPIGTAKRWDQVTAYVRTRTLDEVMVMVKERQV